MRISICDKNDDSIDGYVRSILRMNARCLRKNYPDLDVDNFVRDVYKAVEEEGADAYELTDFQGLRPYSPMGDDFAHFNPSLALVAYCCQASRAYKDGDCEGAWKNLIEAGYWMGMVYSVSMMPAITVEVAKNTLTENGKKGGGKKSQKSQIVKNEAYRLVREGYLRQKDGWQSASYAAKVIMDDLIEFAKNAKYPFSSNRPERTVERWLSEMEDKNILFGRNGRS